MFYARLAEPDDVPVLAATLRDADRDEVLAASGRTPLEALTDGLRWSSPAYTLVDGEGTPIAMLGVVPLDDLAGSVWLLGTDGIQKESIRFLRGSRLGLQKLHEVRPVLTNAVDARNTLHIRWLQWLGFTFLAEVRGAGPGGLPFYEFVRVSHV